MINNKAKKINFTELTPFRNYDYEKDGNGTVRVLVPMYKNGLLDKLFSKFTTQKYNKAELDEIGSEVWMLINGENKIQDIVLLAHNKFGDKIEPAYERITLFLSQMHKNNFINFIEYSKGKKL